MKTSWLAAVAVVILLCVWMATGLLATDEDETASETVADEPMAVVVKLVTLEKMDREVSLHGQLEPIQHLFLKAETSGRLERLLVEKGQRVTRDEPLAILDGGTRQSALSEARARVKSARSEQAAAASLRGQRLQSQVQLEQTEAALESALSQLASIELDIDNLTITSPFAAVINDLPVDPGSLVERGDIVAELVDDSAFNVSAQAAQQTIARLEIGQPVKVTLLTGEELPGTLTFISVLADSQTRSFRVEAQVDNETGAAGAGVSASMTIPVEQIEAAFVSPSAFALGEDGELGVKAVDDNDLVFFQPIELISTSLDGAWVVGIPANTRIITLGQGFVAIGEKVAPQMDTEENQAALSRSHDSRLASAQSQFNQGSY